MLLLAGKGMQIFLLKYRSQSGLRALALPKRCTPFSCSGIKCKNLGFLSLNTVLKIIVSIYDIISGGKELFVLKLSQRFNQPETGNYVNFVANYEAKHVNNFNERFLGTPGSAK